MVAYVRARLKTILSLLKTLFANFYPSFDLHKHFWVTLLRESVACLILGSCRASLNGLQDWPKEQLNEKR